MFQLQCIGQDVWIQQSSNFVHWLRSQKGNYEIISKHRETKEGFLLVSEQNRNFSIKELIGPPKRSSACAISFSVAPLWPVVLRMELMNNGNPPSGILFMLMAFQ